MKAVGIIAEYNPLHKGHEYHISEARRQSGADCTVAVISGNFVQQGRPSILGKYSKARQALLAGVDLVLELPVFYATSSAEKFAEGSVKTLSAMGVKEICFGSETPDPAGFCLVSDVLLKEPEEYRQVLKTNLAAGISFPKAREQALVSYFKTLRNHNETVLSDKELKKILTGSNNNLGLEYYKAASRFSDDIQFLPVKRLGSGYNERDIKAEGYKSATALRADVALSDATFTELSYDFLSNVPEQTRCHLQNTYKKHWPIFMDDFSEHFLYLMNVFLHAAEYNTKECATILSSFYDVSEDLAFRILRLYREKFTTLTDLCDRVKNKQITYSHVSRALIHILLGLTEERKSFYEGPSVPYIRVLGMNQKGQQYLKEAAVNLDGSIPIIVSPGGKETLLQDDVFASSLYNQVMSGKFHYELAPEYRQKPIIM